MWESLSLKLKGRLYKSCIRSVMSYGSECWAIKKVDTRRMQVAKMRMIRMMCGRYRESSERDETEMAWAP